MKELCSVLISTCDKYEDAWAPFFFFVKQHWKDCPYKFYLNTETKQYCDDTLEIEVLNGISKSWSTRLMSALSRINTEYIILLLEDFFLLSDVQQGVIENSLEIMEKDKRIAVIDFEPDINSLGNLYDKNKDYFQRSVKSMYFLNCQSAIWRRKDLIRFLSPYESPWQFEIYGSQRVKLYNKTFLLWSPYNRRVFNYNVNWTTGYGIHGGKWLKSNVKLFNDNNIKVDFEKMGFYEHSEIEPPKCPAPRVTFFYRLRYLFLSGGHIENRMPINRQLICAIKKPKEYFAMVKRKITRVFSKDFFNNEE